MLHLVVDGNSVQCQLKGVYGKGTKRIRGFTLGLWHSLAFNRWRSLDWWFSGAIWISI